MQNSLRGFIALEIPEGIQVELNRVIIRSRLNSTNGFRPVRPGMIHLTLKFLGDVPLSSISEIQLGLSKLADLFKPLTFQMKGLGAFSSWDHPRTIWAGMVFPQELTALSLAIDKMCAQLSFPIEKRPLSPHLTLVRISDRADFVKVRSCLQNLRQNQNDDFGMVSVSQITLFQSTLQPGGSIYTRISIHPFGEDRV